MCASFLAGRAGRLRLVAACHKQAAAPETSTLDMSRKGAPGQREAATVQQARAGRLHGCGRHGCDVSPSTMATVTAIQNSQCCPHGTHPSTSAHALQAQLTIACNHTGSRGCRSAYWLADGSFWCCARMAAHCQQCARTCAEVRPLRAFAHRPHVLRQGSRDLRLATGILELQSVALQLP